MDCIEAKNVSECPVCGQPLSFRDEKPFCREKGCAFNVIYRGARMISNKTDETRVPEFEYEPTITRHDIKEMIGAFGLFGLLFLLLTVVMCF